MRAAGPDGLDGVRVAIAQAVAERFHVANGQVAVGELRADAVEADGPLVAVPDPGARTGQPAQFTLRAGSRRVGLAVASVTVTAPHVRTAAPVERDAALTAEAVQEQDGEVVGVRFEPLPRLEDVVGAHARRTLVVGEVLSQAVVIVPDAVRAGDEVKVVARVGALEAWGVGRATASGRVGDVVRITRGSARGLQPARVLSPGVVQVLLAQPQEIR
ncbi:MAG TPA: flagellar basal body P-ring formation chaperone FlgA [Methylomirabilota bacterium]|nr:flagellar basal body P-ring formation chaperone FlgA [Methylomirabilota bacterium]